MCWVNEVMINLSNFIIDFEKASSFSEKKKNTLI